MLTDRFKSAILLSAAPPLPVAKPPAEPPLIVLAETIRVASAVEREDPDPVEKKPEANLPSDPVAQIVAFFASFFEWIFGAAAIILGLSILTAIPFAQFLVLGYLLEVSGRVARTGKLSAGFVGVRKAARIGGIALGCVLWWLPLWGLSALSDSAQVIEPAGRIAQQWSLAVVLLAMVYVLHVGMACLRGGRLRWFFWPFNFIWVIRELWKGTLWRDARDGLWNTVLALRLPYYFWLGLRGFVGGFLWLVLPLVLLGLGHINPGVGVLGAVLFAFVVLYVPYLQTLFARDNQFRAFWRFQAVRRDFRKAPIAFALALMVQLLFAMPLYLLKIELIRRDLIFLEGLVFLAFIFPARLLTGWAYGRATLREQPRHWFFRWFSRFAVLPFVAAYVFVVWTSQHLGWNGISSLYEQHAFLLPVPFVQF